MRAGDRAGNAEWRMRGAEGRIWSAALKAATEQEMIASPESMVVYRSLIDL